MNPLTFDSDFFVLFGLPRQQALDVAALVTLDAHYRELQARVHPDKHAHASAADQRLAMQWATRVNEAYRTLKSPLSRARYLLGLLGQDAAVDSNTAMPMEFLMAQMELRESVEAAKVSAGDTAIVELDNLATDLRTRMREEYVSLAERIDTQRDYTAAAQLIRQLMFQEKLLTDIDDALDVVSA